MPKTRYPTLFSPAPLGPIELRNRIIVAAMGVNLAEEGGFCGERIRRYHAEQARGGAGMVITGVAGVAWPVGAVQPRQVAISDDRFIPGLKAVADAIHAGGAKMCAQLHHGGLVAAGEAMRSGEPLWTPSLPEPPKGDFTQAMLPEELAAAAEGITGKPEFKVLTKEDIQTVVKQFAAAARRAREAGADAVEIHAGHGYLLSSFISPRFNKREDEYGGTLEKRARLLLEVLRAVRDAAGSGMAVLCKLDTREIGVPPGGGITLDDAEWTARQAQAAGADAITASAYHDTAQGKLHSESNIPHVPGFNLPAAARIKGAVTVPVVASGRVEPAVAEKKIAAGAFDFLAMGRKLLADPHLPDKLRRGADAAVRPCIYCYTCVSAIYTRDPVRCAVNPATGREHEYREEHHAPNNGARAVVIGGGPGGMAAARLLALAGREVILLERGSRLGGTLQFASLAYSPNERILRWLRREIAQLPVEVRLNTPATVESVKQLAPDLVIVATGARRDMPPIPGSDLPHVLSGDDLRRLMLGERSAELRRKIPPPARALAALGAAAGITARPSLTRRATHWWMPLGRRIAIIGGELVGLELAEFLLERGRQVAVFTETDRPGAGLPLVRRMRLLAELEEQGARLIPAAANIRIAADAVRYQDAEGAPRQTPADHIIIAQGAQPDAQLADALRAADLNVRAIGDCEGGVSYIEGALRGAADAVAAAV